MIGTIHDVLLAVVNGHDTVNDWRNKTNAIIDFINKTPLESMPAILFSPDEPINQQYMLWFDTSDNNLLTWHENAWRPFHQVYSYEMKFYKKVINNNKIIPQGFNALAVSPEIAEGVTVEIEEGSVLRIV